MERNSSRSVSAPECSRATSPRSTVVGWLERSEVPLSVSQTKRRAADAAFTFDPSNIVRVKKGGDAV
jgi:hypothetical protein